MSNVETEAVVKNGADAPVKDNSILGQIEKLLNTIVEAKVQEAIHHMELVGEDRLRGCVANALSEELDAKEIPDLYGVRDIVSEEIDNIDWNDRVSESGALDGIVTEDTLEGTLDEVVSNEYVTRSEFEDALDGLSISRG